MLRGRCPPRKYHPPEVPPDLFVMPAGPVDGVSLTRDLTVPVFPTKEKSTKFRLQPPETVVSQSRDNANSLRECVRALSTYIGSCITPIHHFVHARMVRAVPSVSLRMIWR